VRLVEGQQFLDHGDDREPPADHRRRIHRGPAVGHDRYIHQRLGLLVNRLRKIHEKEPVVSIGLRRTYVGEDL